MSAGTIHEIEPHTLGLSALAFVEVPLHRSPYKERDDRLDSIAQALEHGDIFRARVTIDPDKQIVSGITFQGLDENGQYMTISGASPAQLSRRFYSPQVASLTKDDAADLWQDALNSLSSGRHGIQDIPVTVAYRGNREYRSKSSETTRYTAHPDSIPDIQARSTFVTVTHKFYGPIIVESKKTETTKSYIIRCESDQVELSPVELRAALGMTKVDFDGMTVAQAALVFRNVSYRGMPLNIWVRHEGKLVNPYARKQSNSEVAVKTLSETRARAVSQTQTISSPTSMLKRASGINDSEWAAIEWDKNAAGRALDILPQRDDTEIPTESHKTYKSGSTDRDHVNPFTGEEITSGYVTSVRKNTPNEEKRWERRNLDPQGREQNKYKYTSNGNNKGIKERDGKKPMKRKHYKSVDYEDDGVKQARWLFEKTRHKQLHQEINPWHRTPIPSHIDQKINHWLELIERSKQNEAEAKLHAAMQASMDQKNTSSVRNGDTQNDDHRSPQNSARIVNPYYFAGSNMVGTTSGDGSKNMSKSRR